MNVNLSDTESEGGSGEMDWATVAAGGSRRGKRERGKSGRGAGQQQGLLQIPGALGLLRGDERGRQMFQMQQQQFTGNAWEGGDRQDTEIYPKVVARNNGIRHVNTCALYLGNIKVGPKKTYPSEYDCNMFLLRKCNLKLEKLYKVAYMS